jgi:hypothetical protein
LVAKLGQRLGKHFQTAVQFLQQQYHLKPVSTDEFYFAATHGTAEHLDGFQQLEPK